MGAVILEQQLNMATEAFVAEQDAITSCLASITLYISLIAFFVQIWLTGRIHRFLGVGFALLVLPVSLAVTSLLILLFPVVWIAAFARVQDSSLRYTLDKTSREILFLPLPADLKHKAKPFVDVAVDRLMGKGLASILLLVLVKVFDFEWYQLSYLSVAMVGLWMAMAVGAKREYIAAFRRRLAQGDLSTADVTLLTPDLTTLEVLVAELGGANEQRVLTAIDLLEFLDKRQLVTPLLLHHPSTRVRARALRAVAVAQPKIREEWLPAIESSVADDHAEVRAAALAALAAIKGAAVSDLMRTHLADPNPETVAMAAGVLAQSGRDKDVEAAEHALIPLIENGGNAAARGAAARAIGDSVHPRLRRLLVPLLSDVDEDVTRTAIAAARRTIDADAIFLPLLVTLLGHRRLKQAARASLVSYGRPSLPALGHFLRDPDESPWIRRHLPATLKLIPYQESVDLLLSVLDDPDGFVRYKAISALADLHREQPELRFDPKRLETLAFDEAAHATRYWRAHGDLFGGDSQPETLLASALRQKVQRGVGRIYELLALIYPWRDIAAVRWTLEHSDPAARIAAAEYLDNLLKTAARRRLMPLIEDVAFGRWPDTRASAVESTLAGLLRDDDPIIAAVATSEVATRKLWGLTPVLEDLTPRTDPAAPYVADAAASVLASRDSEARRAASAPLSVVNVADRLHALSLFSEAAVGELLQIAAIGEQVPFAPGDALADENGASRIVLLLQGEARLMAPGDEMVRPPALFGLREVLEGSPMRVTARAVVPSLGLVLEPQAFLTVLSTNVELIEGLARMLLESTAAGSKPAIVQPAAGRPLRPSMGEAALTPVEKALLLRDVPSFSRATTTELTEMSSIAREVALAPGSRLFSEYDPPSLHIIVSGELLLRQADGEETFSAVAGDVVGAYIPLEGGSSAWRAEVLKGGTALALTRADLFELLADRIELLQGVFRALFETERFRMVNIVSSARNVERDSGVSRDTHADA